MSEARVRQIELRLRKVFEPNLLEVFDESHLHAGHAGAKEGKGHFRIRIVAEQFAGKAPLQRHRMVYDALAPMMNTDIHALSIFATEKE